MSDQFDLEAAQYARLGSEIEKHVSETWRIETATALGAAAIYAWLFTNVTSIGHVLVWWIPPVLVLLGGMRCMAILRHIEVVGYYLRLVEKGNGFGGEERLGWESYRASNRKKPSHRTRSTSAVYYWVVLFLVSIAVTVVGFEGGHPGEFQRFLGYGVFPIAVLVLLSAFRHSISDYDFSAVLE